MFTHSSWAPDRASSYERLEFLGDSVLELAVARHLYDRYPELSEGRLAKIRSHVVSRRSCAAVARQLGLGERLAERGAAAQPEELSRLAENRNVLAALLEAALAAIFLERGFEAVQGAIVEAFAGEIEYAATHSVDYKTDLQEELARARKHVVYAVVEMEGPAHDRRFTCAALIDGEQRGVGTGSTKKDAEQAAALEALHSLALEREDG
ncbi:MAG TPA: ribonuclease III [Gaiellaceae bacterium]|nr:ribonuclease III [Gaiellaceae bacterium]